MDLIDFSKRIDNIYTIISNRQNEKKIEYINAGFDVSRISFEDIDLEDIFIEELIPLLGPSIDYFKSTEVQLIRNKIYKIYIATLCEMAKSGFNQGGILKTMDTYVGYQFDRNRHYKLIKDALDFENIEILSNKYSHYYEETIINEAGIPKKFHRDVLALFLLYWKWMKGIEKKERMEFLKDFINEEPIFSAYILLNSDYEKMKSYREATSDFKEKTLKVCNKLEEIFCAIDEYPELINENNIANVCSKVSENLRFNIETVIRISDIHKIFLKYSQRISFSKLQKIINNLSVDENIIIPTGETLTKERYHVSNFYGGLHTINGIIYEVSYSIGLTLEEIFDLPRRVVQKQNQNYIYVSDEYFQVEIDGIPQNIKTFIFNNQSVYVYVGMVPSASVAYIDDICTQTEESYRIDTSIRKIWDRELKKNLLAIYIKEARCCNADYATQSVCVSNGFNSIIRQTNRNGFSIIRDKWLGIPDLSNLNDITVTYSAANIELAEIKINMESIMVFSFQSGIQIKKTYDSNQFYGDNRLIIYTIRPIETLQNELISLDYYQGLYVYYAEMDLTKEKYIIDDISIIIKNHNKSYMTFMSPYDFKDDKVCFEEDSDILICIHNIDKPDIYYLKLSHDSQIKTISLNIIDNFERIDIKKFMIDYDYQDGKWTLTLYKEQENIFEINYTVLPKLITRAIKPIHCEGEKVNGEIFAISKCFFINNDFSSSVQIDMGIAQIEMKENLVTAKELTYEVYNARNDCFQNVTIRPTVWGIRLLDNETSTWISIKDVSLTYKSLSRYGVFVVTSGHHYLNIECDSIVIKREIFAGYNRIDIKRILTNWKEVNHICIFDEFNIKKMITVVFEPNVKYINTVFENSLMISTLSYEGSINTDILFRVYANGTLIKTISRNAKRNKFMIHIVLPKIQNYNGQELIFEVSFDNRDPIILHNLIIEASYIQEKLTLSRCCNLYKLIEEYFNNDSKNKFISIKELNIMQIIGGF